MLVPSPLRARRGWSERVTDAPAELVRLVQDAMIDFGPDGHCDGADVIAALALQWVVESAPTSHSEEPASMIVVSIDNGIVRIGFRDAVKLHSGDVIEVDLDEKTVWIDESQR